MRTRNWRCKEVNLESFCANIQGIENLPMKYEAVYVPITQQIAMYVPQNQYYNLIIELQEMGL